MGDLRSQLSGVFEAGLRCIPANPQLMCVPYLVLLNAFHYIHYGRVRESFVDLACGKDCDAWPKLSSGFRWSITKRMRTKIL